MSLISYKRLYKLTESSDLEAELDEVSFGLIGFVALTGIGVEAIKIIAIKESNFIFFILKIIRVQN
jgi:hypothetical protein